jgi:cell division protein FtsW
MKNILATHFKGDKIIWFVIIFLSIVSIVSVYTSIGDLAYRFKEGNTSYYLIRHLKIMALGFVVLYFVHKAPYNLFFSISEVVVVIAVILLLITIFSKVAVDLNDAQRAIKIGGFEFQTSDFAKIAAIIYISRVLSTSQESKESLFLAFIKIILPIGLICGLIIVSSSSTALLLFFTTIVMMFIGRIPLKRILQSLFALFVLVSLMYGLGKTFPNLFRLGTFASRVDTFFNGGTPDSNRQPDMAKAAIATSGPIGKMPGNSSVRYSLPQAYSDFIFAILIEEWGSIAGVMVLLSYLILLYRTGLIVKASSRTFPAFLAIGLTVNLVFQALANMSVAVGIVPVTGQPLPIVSMGGTSLVMTFLALGIILSISRSLEKESETENIQKPEVETQISK